jgi:hypothetical protein
MAAGRTSLWEYASPTPALPLLKIFQEREGAEKLSLSLVPMLCVGTRENGLAHLFSGSPSPDVHIRRRGRGMRPL